MAANSDLRWSRHTVQGGRAPTSLHVLGDASCLLAPCVAVVGTRSASSYGRSAARDFARCLARAGVTVVSGGALGNDTEAHEGALEAGRTAAVLPCGADVAYPSRNRGLFERIVGQGCLASEFEPGSPVSKGALQARNATIARVSAAVVVVEAPAGSGALITARAAAALGKPVYVVPGPYALESFRGGHALLSQGALVADDPLALAAQFGRAAEPSDRVDDDAVVAVLRAGPAEPDAIVRATGLSPEAVLELLTMLEIEGRVRRAGGGYALAL